MLSPVHQSHLEASGVSAEIAAERGYQSMQGSLGYETLRHAGFSKAQSENLPGLLLPVWGTDGQATPLAVYRPDMPRLSAGDTPRKYEFPHGKGMRLDCPPRCVSGLGDPTIVLWITEGQKKGDALATVGACTLALLGVDCWRGRNQAGGTTALADWEYVHLRERQIYIAFDSDMQTKPQVKGAMRRLANFLKAKGARVGTIILPTRQDGDKQGIDDFLVHGGTLAEAITLVEDPWQDQPTNEESLALAHKADLPKIRLIPGELSQLVGGASQAILTWQAQRQPVLFQRAGRLCFIVRDLASPAWLKRPPLLPQIQDATPAKVRALCNETAAWYKYDGRVHGWKLDLPPVHVVQTLLELGEWQFPPLQGIATRPFFRPNGTLCQTPGYDSATGVYLECPAAIPQLLDPTTPLDIFAAEHDVQVLRELFQDFPFAVTERDFAATLAALLTLLVRPAIEGQTPLIAIGSSTPGSGKGLLADLLCLIALGDVAPRWAPTHEAEEERKRLMTIALAGEQVAMIDNVQGLLGSEALDMVITAGMVYDRALGSHGLLKAPWKTVLFATGNNMTYHGDLGRRVMPIALQPDAEHPEERNDFVLPHIRAYCREHQWPLLKAACHMFACYLAAGAPAPPTGHGSFEAWNALIRGGVLWLTGQDCLEGQRTLLPRDPELEEWSQILHAWHVCLGSLARTVPMLIQEIDTAIAHEKGQSRDADQEVCTNWQTLKNLLATIDPRSDGARINGRMLGKMCVRYRGRTLGRYRLADAGEYNQTKLWRVELSFAL